MDIKKDFQFICGTPLLELESFNKLIHATEIIGNSIYKEKTSGEKTNGKEYITVNLMESEEDIKESLELLNEFFHIIF